MNPAQIDVHKIASLTGHTSSIYTLYQDPADTSKIYSGAGDGMVVVWDLADPGDGKLVAKVDTNIFSLEALTDRQLFLLGQLQGGIHVMDRVANTEIKHLALHTGGVFEILRSLNGRQFIAAGGDGVLSVWNVADLSFDKQLPISNQSLRCMAFSPSGDVLAVGSSDGRVYLLDAHTYLTLDVLESHVNSVFTVAFTPDGQYLLSGSRDAHLNVWKVGKKYQLYRRITAHMSTVNSIAVSPDGSMIATAGRDKEVRIWSAKSFDLLKVIGARFDGHVNSVNRVLWTTYNNMLISASDDRSLMLWDIKMNKEL